MRAYKGFDKDMKCRGFQFEEGKTYEEQEASLCNKGFHACEHPLDCFSYYPPATSVYHEVELEDVSDERGDDTKIVGKKITIGAKLGIADLVNAAVDFTFSKAEWEEGSKATGLRGAASATGDWGAASATGERGAASATGDWGAASATGERGAASATGERGAASATGDWGAASATGYQGAASATGDWGAASATGYQGAAVSLGIFGKAMGALGCWIVCAEWARINGKWHRVDVKSAKVDGETIKPDTWYCLENGDFVEVADDE